MSRRIPGLVRAAGGVGKRVAERACRWVGRVVGRVGAALGGVIGWAMDQAAVAAILIGAERRKPENKSGGVGGTARRADGLADGLLVAWYLVFDASEREMSLTVVRVRYREHAKRDEFVETCHNRGMWITALHPGAAAVLNQSLPYSVHETGTNADAAIECFRAGGGA